MKVRNNLLRISCITSVLSNLNNTGLLNFLLLYSEMSKTELLQLIKIYNFQQQKLFPSNINQGPGFVHVSWQHNKQLLSNKKNRTINIWLIFSNHEVIGLVLQLWAAMEPSHVCSTRNNWQHLMASFREQIAARATKLLHYQSSPQALHPEWLCPTSIQHHHFRQLAGLASHP